MKTPLTKKQLTALIDFIASKASEVTHHDVGLSDAAYADASSEEEALYEAFNIEQYDEL